MYISIAVMPNFNEKKLMIFLGQTFSTGRNIIKGVVHYVSTHGLWDIYLDSENSKRATSIIDKWKPDAIIAGYSCKLIKDISDKKIPVYVICEPYPNERIDSPYVGYANTDEYVISRLTLEHFTNRGFKNFAYCEYSGVYCLHERVRIFNEMVKEAGYNIHFYQEKKGPSPYLVDEHLDSIME